MAAAARTLSASLRKAAAAGDVEELGRCLAKVTDAANRVVNYPDIDTDMTALMLASAGGHEECCRELLQARADPNVEADDAGNRQALHFAAYGGHSAVVSLLLTARAQPSSQSSGGTAHDVAALRAKQWTQGGGDGEENIDGLNEVLTLLQTT
eukprot:TRINITY_DN64193_c0_g1_i1.p2 TRINITY_DN64193_c0_g1~~TRINITY_DN64193_c0_g1_i1.p2  ORF type:complete len:153 (-),score=32.85 TRINITY_DN64193_c0_g1_i1:78-536(-)